MLDCLTGFCPGGYKLNISRNFQYAKNVMLLEDRHYVLKVSGAKGGRNKSYMVGKAA